MKHHGYVWVSIGLLCALGALRCGGGGGGPALPGAFTLTTPPDAAVNVSRTPTLTWTDASDETDYTLDVATDAAFAAILYTQGLATDTVMHGIPAATLDFDTDYFWRVTAHNAQGDTTASNAPLTFRTLPLLEAAAPVPLDGTGPRAIALGDLDGNGRLDFTTANETSGDASVFLQDLAGAFNAAASSPLAAGPMPQDVVVDDFDGGSLDVVIVSLSDPTLRTYPGDGAGGFAVPVDTTTGPPTFLGFALDTGFAAQMNPTNDSNLDLVCGLPPPFDQQATPMFGNGTGGFPGFNGFNASANTVDVAAGDFDGDTFLDIVTTLTSNEVTVRGYNGMGALTSLNTTTPTLALGTLGLATGYFDAGAALDVVTANDADDSVTVLLGDGAGSFASVASHVLMNAGAGPRAVAAADMDGDGKLDVVTANAGDDTASVLFGDGAGGFTAELVIPVGLRPFGVAIGDVEGDGDLDFVVVTKDDSSVYVVRNNLLP